MKDSYLGLLAKETVLNCINFLNVKSLIQLNQTCRTMEKLGRERSIWLNLCFQELRTKALIEAAHLDNDLIQGHIDPHLFFTCVLANKVDNVCSLLFLENDRIFSLWLPCYLPNKPSFFSRTPDAAPRHLYLTRELAIKETPNAYKVTHWLKANIAINTIDFEQLFLNNKLSHTKQITFEYSEKTIQNKNLTDCPGYVWQ